MSSNKLLFVLTRRGYIMKYETKNKRIMVRLTETQFKKLERIADRNGMKPSQYMRYLFNTKGK